MSQQIEHDLCSTGSRRTNVTAAGNMNLSATRISMRAAWWAAWPSDLGCQCICAQRSCTLATTTVLNRLSCVGYAAARRSNSALALLTASSSRGVPLLRGQKMSPSPARVYGTKTLLLPLLKRTFHLLFYRVATLSLHGVCPRERRGRAGGPKQPSSGHCSSLVEQKKMGDPFLGWSIRRLWYYARYF